MTGYGCPFCGSRIDYAVVLEDMLRTAFEAHLDRHLARGDQLRPAPLPRAS